MKYLIILFLAAILFSCENDSSPLDGKIDTAQELQKEIKETQDNSSIEFSAPKTDIDELEMEINNGGFNQYFFNSSGQNCFKTLEKLKTKEDKYHVKLAVLLEQAIDVVNTENISQEALIIKIQNRTLESLDDETVNERLDSLDNIYYRN